MRLSLSTTVPLSGKAGFDSGGLTACCETGHLEGLTRGAVIATAPHMVANIEFFPDFSLLLLLQ